MKTAINKDKTPPSSAVLPFYAAGALVFLFLTILLLTTSGSLASHYFNPHLLTIVHLAVLGWGTMIIFGAAYELLPVVSERNLFSSRLAQVSFYALVLGVSLLAGSFWNFSLGWPMILGGSIILASVVCFAINVWFTIGSISTSKFNPANLFMVSSAFWLLFTVSFGLLLAINLAYPFFSSEHMELLKMHAHAGLAGWFLQLISGVSIKLVPMFLLGKSNKEYSLKWAFILQNLGLILFLFDAFFFGSSWRFLIYGLLVLVGFIAWFLYIYDVFVHRLRKKIDWLMRHTLLSFILLFIVIVSIPLVYYSKGTSISMIYGTLAILGWVTCIILGMSFKTLPFIVWNMHYKNLNGKMKVPLPKDLYKEKLLPFQFWIYLVALVSLCIGILTKMTLLIDCSLYLWIAVALLYNINVFKVLFHTTTTKE